MPYDGYMTYAGTELFNVPRTTAYLRNILPSVQVEDTCGEECTCDHLPALLGHVEYNNPFIDDAPWVDLDRPESFDFLGFYPTEIVGLTDDTTRATVEERVGNGGWITDTRRASREVYVNGVLIASSMEGAHYGETWLKAMMEGSCDDSCGIPTDTLCFLTACVDPAEMGGTRYHQRHVDTEWRLSNGAHWNGNTLVFPTMGAWAELSLPHGFCGPVEWELDLSIIKGGSNLLIQHEDGWTEAYYVRGGQDFITVTTQGTKIRLSAAPTAKFLQTPAGGAQWTPQPGAAFPTAAYWQDHPYGDGNAEWWGTLPASTPVGLEIVFDNVRTVSHKEDTADDCLNDLMRSIPKAARSEGPIFGTENHLPSGAVIRRAHFTFTSESAFIYGAEREVISGPLTGPRVVEPSVLTGRRLGPIAECKPTEKPGGAIHDPLRGSIPKPPAPSQTKDTLRNDVIAHPSDPYAVLIPADMISSWQSTVPVLRVTAGSSDVRFLSIKFYPVPLDSTILSEVDPCSACGGMEIAYIPGGATFVADAIAETGTIQRGGYTDTLANSLLTGPDGKGRAAWPELSCGSAYLMVVQTYGQTLSDVSLSLAVRE